MNSRIILAFLALLALSVSATAQSAFPTPNGSTAASGAIIMCPKTGANPVTYVPCDATNPAAVSNTPSGTQSVTLPTTGTIAAGNAVVEAVSSETGAGATPISSSALAANLVVKASAGNLYSFEVSATSTLYAANWYIMIHNATSAPADGAVTPAKCYLVPAATGTFAAAFPHPVNFSTGITIGVSTTGCFSKTASTQAFISGDFK